MRTHVFRTTAGYVRRMSRRVVSLLLLSGCVFALFGLSASASVLPGFHSPSGNIKCLFVPGHPSVLRCNILHSAYSAKLQARCMAPGGAGVDWHGFELTATGKGAVTCSGGILYNPDTQHPSYMNLPYGTSWHQGVFTCVSRVTGVTCHNRLGHELFISRQSWRAT